MADGAPRPDGLPLVRVEYAAVVLSALVVQLYLVREWGIAPAWDAGEYIRLARSVESDGMLAHHQGGELRTYLYPLLLAGAAKLAGALGLPFRFVVAQAQYFLYLGAAFAFRSALVSLAGPWARPVFCGLVLNYYVLSYAPLTLTESVSVSLTLAAATLWMLMCRDGVSTRLALGLGVVVGAALVVRPANIFLVVTAVAGVGVLLLRDRSRGWGVLVVLAGLVGAVAPMVPQIAINVRHFDHVSVFPRVDLASFQIGEGIRYLKYGTATAPIPAPRIEYENPFQRGTLVPAECPQCWYAENPLAGIATLALHLFAMTDQDLLFTYSRDLTPWFRLPLGVVNHAAVALGILGLALCAWRTRAVRSPDLSRGIVALAALLATSTAVHAPTAVEMRFGIVLLLALFPAASCALVWVAARADRPTFRILVLGIALYVAGALALSEWMRAQSPQIRAAAKQAMDHAQPR